MAAVAVAGPPEAADGTAGKMAAILSPLSASPQVYPDCNLPDYATILNQDTSKIGKSCASSKYGCSIVSQGLVTCSLSMVANHWNILMY